MACVLFRASSLSNLSVRQNEGSKKSGKNTRRITQDMKAVVAVRPKEDASRLWVWVGGSLLVVSGALGILWLFQQSRQQKLQRDIALIKAAGKGELNVVRSLIAAKADVNFVTWEASLVEGADWVGGLKTSPLIEASRNGQTAVVQMLLDAGGDVLNQVCVIYLNTDY